MCSFGIRRQQQPSEFRVAILLVHILSSAMMLPLAAKFKPSRPFSFECTKCQQTIRKSNFLVIFVSIVRIGRIRKNPNFCPFLPWAFFRVENSSNVSTVCIRRTMKGLSLLTNAQIHHMVVFSWEHSSNITRKRRADRKQRRKTTLKQLRTTSPISTHL